MLPRLNDFNHRRHVLLAVSLLLIAFSNSSSAFAAVVNGTPNAAAAACAYRRSFAISRNKKFTS